MAILALDSGIRPQATSWGTSSDGQSWTQFQGTGGTYAIAGTFFTLDSAPSTVYGQYFTATGLNAAQSWVLGSKTTLNPALGVTFSLSRSLSSTVGLIGRTNTGSTTYYRAHYANSTLQLQVVVAGTVTTFASTAVTVNLGTPYRLLFSIAGTSPVQLSATLYAMDGSVFAPATPTLTYTDSADTITTSGQFGINFLPNGNTEVTSFDSFTATDGVTPPSFTADSPYGFTFFQNGNVPGLGDPVPDPPTQLFTDLVACKTAQGAGGAVGLRYQLSWYKIEYPLADAVTDPPTNTPEYSAVALATLDYTVAQCNSAGINILICLEDAPFNYRIWNDDGTVAPNSSGQATGCVAPASCYKRFAQFIANRYNGFTGHGQANLFQDGNEEFDTTMPRSGKALIPMANLCYPAIKAIYPGVSVGLGAVRKTVNNASGHISTWCGTVFTGIGPNADWVDFHYYRDGTCTPDPTIPCTDSSQVPTGGQEAVLMQAQLPSAYSTRPINCLETGWKLGYVLPNGTTITEAMRSQYIRGMYDMGRTSGNIWTRCYVFTLDYPDSTETISSATVPTWNDLLTYWTAYPQWFIGSTPPPVTAQRELARYILAMTRLGDGGPTYLRPLTNALLLSYDIAVSQYAAALPISYQVQKANTMSLLLVYAIEAVAAFAINGDTSIVNPDQITYTPRATTAHTLSSSLLLQGYDTMTWTYTTLPVTDFARIIQYYNPVNPVVLVAWANDEGTWLQRNAVMQPPVYGTQQTTLLSDVQITFTRLTI